MARTEMIKVAMMSKSHKKVNERGYIPTKFEGEELQKFLQERSRGCGSHKSPKDYKRTPKHKKLQAY